MSGANTTLNLALTVLAIYVLFGPIILLSIYAFFDRLAEKEGRKPVKKNETDLKTKDPALWTAQDIRHYLEEGRN
ncbi:MAG: hypothetical protein ACLFRQ_08000 [Desulfonatronovibrio sp.]